VRDLGRESAKARAERQRRNLASGELKDVLSRNGASLAGILGRLSAEGFQIADAYAQVRTMPASKFKPERSHLLLTFVAVTSGTDKGRKGLVELFAQLANERWEFLSVRCKYGARPILSIMAKTIADEAKQLKTVEDKDAEEFGIVVSRSVRTKKVA
jgi:hypothetical protein